MKMKSTLTTITLASVLLLRQTLGFSAKTGFSLQRRSTALNAGGLYKPFAEHAWERLLDRTDWFEEDVSVPEELTSNVAPAKGFPEGTKVKMTVKALKPKKKDSVVRYARYALLETILPDTDTDNDTNSTAGIQVLNLVIFPSKATNLPVEIENIANALALAEMRFGAGRGRDGLVMIQIRRGHHHQCGRLNGGVRQVG